MQAVELMTLSSRVFHWHFLYSRLFETTDYHSLLSFQCWELIQRFVFVVVVCKPQHRAHIWRRRSKPSSHPGVLFFFLSFFGISHNYRKYVLLLNTLLPAVGSRWKHLFNIPQSSILIMWFYISHSLHRKHKWLCQWWENNTELSHEEGCSWLCFLSTEWVL